MTAASVPLHPADDLAGAAKRWQQEGLVLTEGLLPAEEVSAALAELKASDPAANAGPIRRPEIRAAESGAGGHQRAAFHTSQFDGTSLFPLANSPALNRLFVHQRLVEFAGLALDSDDLRIYQSRTWSKRGGHTNYEQPMHRDGNHALIPISNVPEWWHLECFVYLHDIDETNGATSVVPGSVARASLTDRKPVSHAEAPELYDREVLARAPAGSVLAYRSDVWHRGNNLNPGTERHIMVVAFKPATAVWVRFDEHAPLVNRPEWVTFAEESTPEELALFGVPRPGHRYWTEELLGAMGAIYPGLDLTPWFDQL